MDEGLLPAGVYSELVTLDVEALLAEADLVERAMVSGLRNAEAADRLSRHLARVVASVVSAIAEDDRAGHGAELITRLLDRLAELRPDAPVDRDQLVAPPRMLDGVRARRPDGSLAPIDLPLTPLSTRRC